MTLVGAAGLHSLSKFRFNLDSMEPSYGGPDEPRFVLATSLTDSSGREAWMQKVGGPNAVAGEWITSAANALENAIHGDIRQWASASILSIAYTDDGWVTARFQLATAKTPNAQRCMTDDVSACATALGLTPGSDSATAPLQYGRLGRSPLDGAARQSLLAEALALGGPHAYDNLTKSKGTIGDQLQATAGVPLNDLLHAWVKRVMTTKLGPTSIDPLTIAASLFWALVCGALALRSSRGR
jgi:hypothetical protein